MVTKNFKTKKWAGVCLAIFGMSCYLILIRNPLPSDNEMMSYFMRHESAFNFLVGQFQDYPIPKGGNHLGWTNQPSVNDVLEKLSVDSITTTASPIWEGEPYGSYNRLNFEKYYEQSFKSSDLMVEMSPREAFKGYAFDLRVVWKRYAFFPIPPQIESGEIIWPAGPNNKPSMRRKLVKSLDRPALWERGECVYREINKNWYLCVCSSR